VAATEAKRKEIRAVRIKRGRKFKSWWRSERKKVAEKKGMAPAVLDMWRTSMKLSPDYARDLKAFWKLPEEFEF